MPTPIFRERPDRSNGAQLAEPIRYPPDLPSITPTAFLRLLSIWLARRRRRQTLAELAGFSEHLLDDIGVSRTEALHEAAKPFWRL
jgi:uncharacterized protein YjiS (DUF1127 family)